MNRQCCAEVKERLPSEKRYLKTNYRVHCNPEEALCPDHCRKFALSDEQDPDFQEKCSHQHTENCNECQNLRNVLDEVEEVHFGSLTAVNIETICYMTSNWHRQIFFSGRFTLFTLYTRKQQSKIS